MCIQSVNIVENTKHGIKYTKLTQNVGLISLEQQIKWDSAGKRYKKHWN